MRPDQGEEPPAEPREGWSGSGEPCRMLVQGMGHGFAHCRLISEGEEAVDWLYLEVNPAFETWTGLKNVVGKRISEVLPHLRAKSPDLFRLYGRVVRTGVPEQLETFVEDLDRWMSIRAFRPGPGEFVATFENISEQKRWEEERHYRDSLLENAYLASPIGMVMVALDGRFLRANPAFCALVGRSEAELEGTTFQDISHPTEAGTSLQIVMDLIEGRRQTAQWEKRYLRKDGREVWAQVNSSLVRDVHGAPLHLVTQVQDINARKRAEAQVREGEEQLRLFVEHAPAAVAMLDADMNYLVVSRRWSEDYRLSRTSVLGHNHYEVFPDLPKRWIEIHRRCLAGATESCEEDPFPRADGRTDWVRWEIRPWHRADESIGGLVILSEVITERKLAQVALQESEEKWRTLTENLQVGVLVQSPTSAILHSNLRALELLGLTQDQLLGKTSIDPAWKVIHEDGTAFPGPTHPVPQAIATLQPVRGIVMGVYRPATRDRVWLLVDALPQLNQDGSLRQVVCTFSDITEIKAAEARLKEALTEAQRFREALDLVPAHVYIKDAQSRYVYANQSTLKLFGCSAEELSGWSNDQFFPPATVQRLGDIDARVFQGERTVAEIDIPDATGGRKVFLQAKSPIYGGPKGQTIWGLLGISTDITERKRAEEAVLRNQTMLSRTEGIAHIGSWEWELATDTVTWSDELFRILHRDPADGALSFARHSEIYPPEDMARLNQAVETTLKEGVPYDLELHANRPDGEVRICRACGFPEKGPNGKIHRIFGSLQDITEAKRAESSLRESEARFASMAENAPVAIYRYSERLGGLYYSPRTQELLGHSPEALLDDPWLWRDSIHPEDLPGTIAAVAAALSGKAEMNVAYRIRHASGQERWFQDRAKAHRLPDGELVIDGVAMDITEIRKAEEDRNSLQAQVDHLLRLESVGQLAGGVAHEINNALASIMAVSSLLQRRGDEVSPLADLIMQASCQGRDIVKALLDFSRKDIQGAALVDLNDLVRKQAELLAHTTRQKIRIQQDLHLGLPRIVAEESALASALMNLTINAVDAMPAGGTLTLKTHVNAAGEVMLSVEDTGEGMTEEVRVRALEPFFTTKPFGKGTGLGLSTAYGIVRAHGGTLDLKSSPGLGTQVLLSLPPAPEQSVIAPAPSAPSERVPEKARRILLVDDDDLVRASLAALLRSMDHQVEVAAGGVEALERLGEGLAVDCVILDLAMPGMDGEETLRRLRETHPRLPVVIGSGDVDVQVWDRVKVVPAVSLLTKPYGLEELEAALRRVD